MSTDRRGWLIVFGILHCLLGLAALLLMFGSAIAADRIPRAGGAGQSVVFYAVATIYFFAIGVGSMRARRWARAIALAISAVWLACGVIGFAALFVVMPHLLVLVPPSQEKTFITAAVTAIFITGIALPLLFGLFYRAASVRGTCDRYDLKPRWTDRLPLPVLALVLPLAFGALMTLMNVNMRVYYVFGVMLTGAPAMIATVAIAALFAIVSLELFRMRATAWWVLLLVHLLTAIGCVAAAGNDINRMYERMGAMTPQVRAMHLETLPHDPRLWAIVAVAWIAYLGFLLWLGGDFPPAAAPVAT